MLPFRPRRPTLVAGILLCACPLAAIAATGPAATAPAATGPSPDDDRTAPIEEIVVTGDLRDATLLRAPVSVTIIDDASIRARGATHLEEVLNVAPNVNFASGASRARFFQIRGIGERGQFAEPLNPSVGVIVDDVDLSGAATAATLFDVEQVEVFRGPQSSRYGANAHAGLIVVRTAAPTPTPEASLEVEAGNYDTRRAAGVVSGPLAGETLTGRLAVQALRSDGYQDNIFLDRDDVMDRDETTVRGRLRWQPDDTWTADLSLSRIEIDNGYDAFSLDNDRDTRSDEPGRDVQDTTLASLRLRRDGDSGIDLEAIAATSDSRIDYAYDEDWTFTGFHPFGYSSTDRYLRDRDTRSLELRLRSDETGRLFGDTTDWLVGVYDHRREVALTRLYTFNAGPFSSDYETGRRALFGQLGIQLTDDVRIQAGLRQEWREADYTDSAGVRFDPDESLQGGRLGIEWLVGDVLLYATTSRGYKAGGFNTDGSLDADLREYDSESVWNHEVGAKGRFADGRLDVRLALFWMDREDQQVDTSEVRVRGDGSAEFIAYVGNAAEGTNLGAELELDWRVSDALALSASLGLLDTEFDDFVNSAGQDLSGREQAHAPSYQFHLAADWTGPGGWFARIEAEGRDDFYWSDSHAEQSRAYELLHARVGWRGERLEVALHSRNLTDENYAVRGFGGFGNDPRNGYADGEYIQLAAPRTIGITTRLSL